MTWKTSRTRRLDDSRETSNGIPDASIVEALRGPDHVSIGATTTFEGMRESERHSHPGVEFGIVIEGELRRFQQGQAVTYSAGDAWLCGVWEPHMWTFVGVKTTIIAVHALPEWFGDEQVAGIPAMWLFAAPSADRPRVESEDVRSAILDYGKHMHREITREKSGWRATVRRLTLLALTELARDWSWRPISGEAQERVASGSMDRIMPAVLLARNTLHQRISIPEAAAACRLSRAQFHRVFPRVMGMSFSDFHQRARLSAAAEQLVTSERTVADIAEGTGFADASHLHRSFRKHYALTPREYRDRHTGRAE